MGLLDTASEIVAVTPAARSAKSFVPSTVVSVPADAAAQKAWEPYVPYVEWCDASNLYADVVRYVIAQQPKDAKPLTFEELVQRVFDVSGLTLPTPIEDPKVPTARWVLAIKCAQLPGPEDWKADPDAHIAFWVYRLREQLEWIPATQTIEPVTAWRHYTSLTDSVYINLGWDGQAMDYKVTVATSVACDLGVSIYTVPPPPAG